MTYSKLRVTSALEYHYRIPKDHEGPDSPLGRQSMKVINDKGDPGAWKDRVTKNITTDIEYRAKHDPALAHHFNSIGMTIEPRYSDGLISYPLVKPSYWLVNNHIRSWAESAGDGYPKSIALQMAAQRHWDLPHTTMAHVGQRDKYERGALEPAREYYKSHHVFLHHFLDSVYQATQENLRDTPELLLHRGHIFYHEREVPDWGKPKTVDELPYHKLYEDNINEVWEGPPHQNTEFSTQPLSSWSTNKRIARAFGNSHYGHVLTSVVPREHVWSTLYTGSGCLNEQEVITIGGHGHAHQTFNSPYHWHEL